MEEILKKREKQEKQDFLKKKSVEKFEFIYNEIQEINEAIASQECDYSCDCDKNTEWIEKIKIEQKEIIGRLECVEEEVYDLDKRVEKIEKMLRIDEMKKMEKRLNKFEAEERTRRYFS